LPTVTMEYNRLSYEADATVGSASMPTLLNTVKAVLKVLLDNRLFAYEANGSTACLALIITNGTVDVRTIVTPRRLLRASTRWAQCQSRSWTGCRECCAPGG
jgi:hypothetical protein